MILNSEILQSVIPDNTSGSLIYKKLDEFEYLQFVDSKNIFKNENFYFNNFTQSLTGYENSVVSLFYNEQCDVDSKTLTLFFGSSTGIGANQADYLKSNLSDTRAIHSKINYMFDYNLNYENFYAIEMHPNQIYDYLNSSYFQLDLSSYDISGNLTSNIFSFISSGSSQYNEITKYKIIPLYSGSLNNGAYSTEEIGKYNPEKNIIVFNADKLDAILNYNTNYSSTTNAKNVNKFYNSFSQSLNISINAGNLPIISTGVISTNVFRGYIDIELNEFNYSNNPTFFDKNTNKFRSSYTNTSPNVYFTAVGLYDSKYQLLAIAKLSKPLPKNDSEKYRFEILIET